MSKEISNTDLHLIRKFKESGDLELLAELYNKYIHLVYGLCMKYFSDREFSKDAVMEIFEKLVTEIPRHEITNFKSWLYVLTKNFCLMELRSRKAQIEKHKKYSISQEIFMESAVEMHPVDEEGSELNKALRDCVEKLKAEQKKCIELFYFEDKCYREISEILRLEEKKVKSYLQNAKRNLKICLENKDGRETGT